ncbi:MAG TPA: cytochrome c oxidase assembly factor Coa1 family protein [Pyrinomonadaceae bacterium]|jgi:TonB family protein
MMNPNQAQFGGSFQQQPPQQQKGCWGRNWKWMVPAGCLGLILGLAALVGGIFFFAMSALKSSDVYRGALAIARDSPAAVERLGQPIKDGWLVKGNVRYEGERGNANLDIPVSGPKKSGTLRVWATTQGGEWTYEKLDLQAEGEEAVSLLDRGAEQVPPGAPVDVEEDADDAAAETEEGEPAETPSPSDGRTISGGVLNAKALSRPEPSYPALAKAARASGVVTVRVTVDETGRVASAEAVSGHPLLRDAAVQAARATRFSPTLLSGRPVKVSGVLTFNFALGQ